MSGDYRPRQTQIIQRLYVAVLASLTIACGTKAADNTRAPEPVEASRPPATEPRATSSVVPPPPVPSTDPDSVYPPPPPSGPMPQNVPPTLLEQNRIAGAKEIEPPPAIRAAIDKSGGRAVMSTKLCVDTSGSVEKPTLLKSSGYQDYDNLILEQIATTWRFRPYEVNGTPRHVCTAWTFLYPKNVPERQASEPAHKGGFWCMSYTVGTTAQSTCGDEADACERMRGMSAQLQSMGATNQSECEWQRTAWRTRVRVEGKREDWFYAARQHCEAMAPGLGGSSCKEVRR